MDSVTPCVLLSTQTLTTLVSAATLTHPECGWVRGEIKWTQQDICSIYLTNYVSGNVPPVPLISIWEVDREDGGSDGRRALEKRDEASFRASLVAASNFLLPLPITLLAAASLRCMNKWQSCAVIKYDTFISMDVCCSSLCHCLNHTKAFQAQANAEICFSL